MNQEKRKIERVIVPGMKVQLCMDDSKGIYDPIRREIKDISYKGIAFYVLKHDYVTSGKHYNFIIEMENKSIGGIGQVKYIRAGLAGMAFSFIDTNQLQGLSYLLDPAYVARTLDLSVDAHREGIRNIRYEAESGAFIEYKSGKDKESLNISFLDKKVEWSSSHGLVLKLYDEFTKEHVRLTPGTSVYMQILSQVNIFVSAARLDGSIKNILKKFVKKEG
jgi:hypothetical protein